MKISIISLKCYLEKTSYLRRVAPDRVASGRVDLSRGTTGDNSRFGSRMNNLVKRVITKWTQTGVSNQ